MADNKNNSNRFSEETVLTPESAKYIGLNASLQTSLGIAVANEDELTVPSWQKKSYKQNNLNLQEDVVVDVNPLSYHGAYNKSYQKDHTGAFLESAHIFEDGQSFSNTSEKKWLLENFNERVVLGKNLNNNHRIDFLKQLQRVETFEHFLHVKFPGAKRFSIEGLDALVPSLNYLLRCMASNTSEKNINTAVICIAHRGRLSVLNHVMNKPTALIIQGFKDQKAPGKFNKVSDGQGDVKYHKGYENILSFHGYQSNLSFNSPQNKNGQTAINVIMMSNPSHLESNVPVALGRVRYLQKQKQNQKAMGIIIHGDAAFSGQGVVYETWQMHKLSGYTTGGNIHIILNNQIGFTCDFKDARSTKYCSDIAKAFNCPVIHVNADDVEACVNAMGLALEYRNLFQKSVVIEMVGYRRFGHNEGDDPTFTQPLMYQKIKNHPTVAKIYQKQLAAQGILGEQDFKKEHETYLSFLQEEFNRADEITAASNQSLKTKDSPPSRLIPGLEQLRELGLVINKIPKNMNINPRLKRVIEARLQALQSGADIDWSVAESLAFACVLKDGRPIRLAGQDSKRGTFSQRHCEWIDTENGKAYVPLNTIHKSAKIECINSFLSEYAALGFEYGHSILNPVSAHSPALLPTGLSIWEAQFGDFANGAQIVIDQYLSSGYSKWRQKSNLILMLPHGYEGQGPEHSSARVERFLQLSADDNWHVLNCSTPANLFHALCNQVKAERPLILFTPKSLLRNPMAVSKLSELSNNHFQTVIPDKDLPTHLARKIIFCTGKVYYDLLAYKTANLKTKKDVAIIRIEQLYPFPVAAVSKLLQEFFQKNPNARHKDIVWCQEEPQNMGAWNFIMPIFYELSGICITYAGRPSAPSPATGFEARHKKEQAQLIEKAFYDV